jgi:hypothetical protein
MLENTPHPVLVIVGMLIVRIDERQQEGRDIREAENSFTSKPGWYYVRLSHFTIILFALRSS